ncbi:MAG: 2-C-methyl-D-erythritol 4-phosphate cytidylyltransferase [Sedimentisphaerales bacterium]|nr:2-C-methyl-D-erythritol 4-phosphate cytidylyltransferase [Sedimentisphaerales bacterium]
MSLKVAVLIPAAGASSRFKGNKKKQFVELDGRAVFLRTIEAFADRPDVSQVILAIPEEDQELFHIKYSANLGFFGVQVVIGGAQRHDTITKMLAEVKDDTDLIAIHDAVRPCVTEAQINDVFDAAAQHGAAILAAPLVGTIKKADPQGNIAQTIDRSQLWEAQTPQVFRPDIIRQAYQQRDKISVEITDDAQLVESLSIPVKLVKSDAGNIKITNGADLHIASAILKAKPKPKTQGPLGPFNEAQW